MPESLVARENFERTTDASNRGEVASVCRHSERVNVTSVNGLTLKSCVTLEFPDINLSASARKQVLIVGSETHRPQRFTANQRHQFIGLKRRGLRLVLQAFRSDHSTRKPLSTNNV